MNDLDFDKIKNELTGLSRRFEKKSSPQFARNMNSDFNFPFREDDTSAFAIRNCIPIWADSESNAISGILLYDIRPEAKTLIYCHTAPLYTYDKDYGCDFFEIPYEVITTMMPTIQDQIVQSVRAAMTKAKTNKKIAALMGQIATDIQYATTADFSVDIYIPPVISPFTGERYFRPGDQYARLFNNPSNDVDHKPSHKFLKYLHKAVTVDLPAHGLKPQYDIYVEMVKKFGSDQKSEDRRSLPDSRDTHRNTIGSDRKKFTNLGLRIGSYRRSF